jgi:hypothetical protein
MLELGYSTESILILDALVADSRGKGEGRIKCTVTKHRVAKTAILFGIQVLSKRSPSIALKLIEKWAPICKPGRGRKIRRRRTGLVLECSSTQGLLEGVDRVWGDIGGAVSHRRVTLAALCLGLDSLNRIEPGKVRRLVSKLCPVPNKYWDPELGLWL